jgi:hypothetical protein
MRTENRGTMTATVTLWIACIICSLVFSPKTLYGAQEEGTPAEDRIELGRLATGSIVTFVRGPSGQWGMEINGPKALRLIQTQPARVEVFKTDDDIRQIAAGYKAVSREADGVNALAELAYGSDVVFRMSDRWSISGSILSLRRRVDVEGGAPGAGFYSAITLSTTPDVTWPDLDYLAPGLLYGDPTYDGDLSPGGTLNYQARHFWMREDLLPAPLFAVWCRDGSSVAVLDSSPRGNTTLGETKADPGPVMIDTRFLFGAVGANEAAHGAVEVGFRLPGSTNAYAGRRGETPVPSWRRRYHPIRQGFVQEYEVAFRLGQDESFPDLTRNAWRWAWQTLKPALNYHDVEVVRRTLIDHLSERVVTLEGRTGIPFIVSTKTGQVWPDADGRWNDETWWWRAILGFVGKNIESADQLLREAERDPGPRGQKMRKQGLDIIETFIRLCPMSPPAGTGFNLKTGKPSMTNPQYNTWFLRAPAEDMRMLMEALRRERRLGRDHPEWLRWCRDFADWALTKQRADGSFPRGFRPGTGEVVEESGTTSYNVVPLFLMLSEDTGDPKYTASAIRAAEYVWQSFGTRGVFIGGAIDNPNITDKEAGMLSMEAFLALYEATREAKWLRRAQGAGDFAETWMWIWNVPMPEDADNEQLHWKKEVPTVGVQGITARVAGHVDQYLDWSAPAYARLYRYTKDPHYLEVARILLHNCKAMTALPGRLYGMLGPGWQQENWRMGPSREGRGFGTPEKWMPWVSTNHLYSITGLEAFDPNLFKELCTKPATNR